MVPFALAVYVPCPDTVTLVRLAERQVVLAVAVVAQSLTVEGASGAEADPAASFEVTAIV
jgi:hypothetical protein